MSATGTPTPNLGLRIPLGTDPAAVEDINYNAGVLDTKIGAIGNDTVKGLLDHAGDEINALGDGLAIIANGNVHAAIAAGEFVFVRNHSSLATGLYKATTAIAANGALSSSNLTADSKGGLNSLSDQIAPSAYDTTGISYSGAYSTFKSGGYFTIGNLVVLNIIVTASESRTSTSKVFGLPASVKPKHSIVLTVMNVVDDLEPQYSIVTNSGDVFIKNIVADKSYSISGCWLKS